MNKSAYRVSIKGPEAGSNGIYVFNDGIAYCQNIFQSIGISMDARCQSIGYSPVTGASYDWLITAGADDILVLTLSTSITKIEKLK
jgi:hypothetical protein